MGRRRNHNPFTAKNSAAVSKTTAAFLWHHRRGLAPFYVASVVAVAAVALYIADRIIDIDRWYLAAVCAIIYLAALSWATGSEHIRPVATTAVTAGTAAAIALAIDPSSQYVHAAAWAGFILISGWWWFGQIMSSLKITDKHARDGQALLSKLGAHSDAHVTKIEHRDEDISWHVWLGDQDGPDTISPKRVAHVWNIPHDRIIIIRDKQQPRRITIKILHQSPKLNKSVEHPALAVNATAEGGTWEPGTRSITDPIPLGTDRAHGKPTYLHLYADGDVRHCLMCGRTGAGKSVSMANIAAGVAATYNAVLAGVDIIKSGATFRPFERAMANLLAGSATDPDNLKTSGEAWLRELQGLVQLCSIRNEKIASGQVIDEEGEESDKWIPTADEPAIVYAIEELASTMEQMSMVDSRLADSIEESLASLAKIARSSGIVLILITQKPDYSQLPTPVRAQISDIIVHELTSRKDLTGLWKEYDIDPVATLSGIKGSSYLGQAESEPILQRGYDLTKPAKRRRIADIYAPHVPQLNTETREIIGWNQRPSTSPEPAPTPHHTRTDDSGSIIDRLRDNVMAAAEDYVAGPKIPPGTPLSIDVPDQDGDDEVDRIIVEALRSGPTGRREIEKSLSVLDLPDSGSTVLRRLQKMQSTGVVEMTGGGRTIRWQLVEKQRELAMV